MFEIEEEFGSVIDAYAEAKMDQDDDSFVAARQKSKAGIASRHYRTEDSLFDEYYGFGDEEN